MPRISFRFSPQKAAAALQWMLARQDRLDLHTALKACYFADKAHLNRHQRPVFGATYRAMRYGPVPLEIYEMAKGEPLWLGELRLDAFPWRLEGYHLRSDPTNGPDLSVFSESDIEALSSSFARAREMTFDERTAATHGPDWQRAELGTIRYEDMLEETPDKPRILEFLEENARYMRL